MTNAAELIAELGRAGLRPVLDGAGALCLRGLPDARAAMSPDLRDCVRANRDQLATRAEITDKLEGLVHDRTRLEELGLLDVARFGSGADLRRHVDTMLAEGHDAQALDHVRVHYHAAVGLSLLPLSGLGEVPGV